MLGDRKAAALVKSIINMSHSLDISVTATGVESRDQLSFLLREHCDKIQGYLASRPVPPKHFEELLRADQRLLPGQVATPAPAEKGSGWPLADQRALATVSEKGRTDLEDLAAVLSLTESISVEGHSAVPVRSGPAEV